LGLVHFRFYDGFAGDNGGPAAGVNGNTEANEINLTYSQDLAFGFSGYVTVARDFTIDGTYGEFGISKSFELSDSVGLDFSATAGYSLDDYYAANLGNGDEAEGWTHVLISLALPMTLTDSATLTPYVSANISQESRDTTNTGADRGDTEVFYGASLAVSF
ncbi:MAG: hypothetical protein ABF380_04095, partial [Akkermansiaceae bacterium]